MKEPALEYLIRNLEILNLIKDGDLENELFRQIKLEAKEMEKQQDNSNINTINKLNWSNDYLQQINGATHQNIYITSDEEIKEGDWFYCPITNIVNQCEIDDFKHIVKVIPKEENIYITSDEFIEEGDFGLHLSTKKIVQYDGIRGLDSYYKKIILTTDQDLIKDGVQAIDDEFLEWFVENPSCESVEVVDDKNFLLKIFIMQLKEIWYILIMDMEVLLIVYLMMLE